MKGPPLKCAHSQVELKISCKNLKNLDVLSKRVPKIFLLVKDAKTQKWKSTIHTTEIIMNDLNPTFTTGMIVDYAFEELQEFRFVCVDVDKPDSESWETQGFIGQFDCDLGSIVASEGRKMMGILTSPNHPGEKRGLIIISAEEVSKSKRNIKLQFQARNIINKGKFFRTRAITFLVISKANEDNTFSLVHETYSVSSSSPCWQFDIRESVLCNGDHDKALLLQVKQQKKNGGHILGECSVTLQEILGGNKTIPLKLPPDLQRKISKNASITVVKALVEEPPSFLDYIAGGTEIRLMVAIDFTGSNGDPRNPKSLHYSGGGENDYQRAIKSVGTVLESYDFDRLFPVYGFGAKFNGILSHVYPLNNNHQNPQVEGVEGILSVYSQAINTVELYGPTNFSPIINLTANKIESELRAGSVEAYYILLIITDGVITDMDLTVHSIIKASTLPLSIVIVGVGNADFSHMTRLDGDDNPLALKPNKSLTRTMGRDIVQFIAMRDFQAEAAGYLLPKAVLEEIPDQLMDYMNKKKISPKPIKQKNVNIDKLQVDPRFDITPNKSLPTSAHVKY